MIAASLLLAETSKTPFYIAAGILVVWAVLLAALGLARQSFGAGRGVQLGIMGVSAVFVVGAMITAAATASYPEHSGKSELKPLPGESAVGTDQEPDQATPVTTGGSASSSSSTPSSSSGVGPPTGTVKVAADPAQLKFTTSSLTAKAGTVTIDFNNPSPIPHDVRIESSSHAQLGGTKQVTSSSTSAQVKLKPGTYTFYCSVDGHRQAGMQGTLTVK